MMPLALYMLFIAPIATKLQSSRRHRALCTKAEAEAAATSKSPFRQPGYQQIIAPLLHADGGYTHDAVIDALLKAEGDETNALKLLRPKGFIPTFSGALKAMGTTCRRVATAAWQYVSEDLFRYCGLDSPGIYLKAIAVPWLILIAYAFATGLCGAFRGGELRMLLHEFY